MKRKSRRASKRKVKKNKFWIQATIGKNRGALHKALRIPIGEKITIAQLHKAEKKGGKLAKRAYLAETLRHLKRGKRRARK